MATIIFNVTVCDGANELISSLQDLCVSREISFDIVQPASDTCIIIGNKPASGQHAMCADTPESITAVVEPLATDREDEPVPAPEPVEIDPGVMPAETIQNQNDIGEISVLSLSTLCAIPAVYSDGEETSKLCVSNVSFGDHITFEYCGSFFKFPLNTTLDQDCINAAEQIDANKIRVVVRFSGSNNIYPIAVEVCEKSQDDPYSMVFGKDLEALKSEMEAHKNVNVPA